MDGYAILQSLKKQRDAIPALKKLPPGSPEFKAWHRATRSMLERNFGNQSTQVTDFSRIDYDLLTSSPSTPTSVFQHVYVQGLTSAQSFLQRLVEHYFEYDVAELDNTPVISSTTTPANGPQYNGIPNGSKIINGGINGFHTGSNPSSPQVAVAAYTSPSPTAVPHVETSPIAWIENLCLRFNAVARQLRDRFNNRPSLEIEDEHDVEDLFHALLRLHFTETRPEIWNPGSDATSIQRDCLLIPEKIVVQTKKTRTSLGPTELHGQVITDLLHYAGRTDIEAIVCFIYDPEGRIGNPQGLEKELESLSTSIPLKVIIAPRSS